MARWTPPPSIRGGRRAELLEAAVDVVAESGLRGLTHRAVDARAGLPEGTCSAYLRTRLALLVALTEHVGGMLARDVDAMAASAAPHAEDPDAVADGRHRPAAALAAPPRDRAHPGRARPRGRPPPRADGRLRPVAPGPGAGRRGAGALHRARRPGAARGRRRGRHRGRARHGHPDAVRPPARVRPRRRARSWSAACTSPGERHATRPRRCGDRSREPRLPWPSVDVRSAPC